MLVAKSFASMEQAVLQREAAVTSALGALERGYFVAPTVLINRSARLQVGWHATLSSKMCQMRFVIVAPAVAVGAVHDLVQR